MKKLWPEFLVLTLFLLSDLLWNGIAAAFAAVSAGILAFLLLFFFGKKKPSLLIEGLIFGVITYIGAFVDYPGGTVLFFELVFALILLISALLGKNILLSIVGSFGKGLFSDKEAFRLSLILGFILFFHGVICTLLALTGFFSWWTGLILFVIIYFVVLNKTKRGTQLLAEKARAILKPKGQGIYILEVGSEPFGSVSIVYENSFSVLVEVVTINSSVHSFLWELENVLRKLKIRTVSILNWSFDEIDIEMDGYSNFEGKWKKKL